MPIIAPCRALVLNGLKKMILVYAGIGIAMAILIESTVRVTIRHSDSPPIASVAATALVNRDDATGAPRLLKPEAPGDRIMAGILQCAGESPARLRILQRSPAILRRPESRKWPKHGKIAGYAGISAANSYFAA
jgi:hypothetical protein